MATFPTTGPEMLPGYHALGIVQDEKGNPGRGVNATLLVGPDGHLYASTMQNIGEMPTQLTPEQEAFYADPKQLQASIQGQAEAARQNAPTGLNKVMMDYGPGIIGAAFGLPALASAGGPLASFGSLAGETAAPASGWVSAEGGAGYAGGMAADAGTLAGAASGGADLVGSDWATGQATGQTGGLLNMTPEGLTAANTAAAAPASTTLTGSKIGDFAAKQAAGTAIKSALTDTPSAQGVIGGSQAPKFVAGSVPDLSASFGSLSGIDLPSGYKNLGPSFRGASNVRT